MGKLEEAAARGSEARQSTSASEEPDVVEIGDSSDEVIEISEKSPEKVSGKKRKSPMSGEDTSQEAIESQTENERHTSNRGTPFSEEKKASRNLMDADSMTRDEVLLTQSVEKLCKYETMLNGNRYSNFMLELVRSKDLRIMFLTIPDEKTLHFLVNLPDS